MADETKELDFDTMSDEDFLKLDEEDAMQAIDSQTPETTEEEEPNGQEPENTDGEIVDGGEPPADDDELNGSGSGDPADALENGEAEETPETDGAENTDTGAANPLGEDGKAAAKPEEPKAEEAKPKAEEKGKEAPKTAAVNLPEGTTPEQATAALDFFSKVTAPFKADGKDFSVRTPEDAVRLMQQGVNYSRRMQEIKPMKAMSRMLQDHGLNDPAKMSFLIDISKGDKAAITKLLKDNNLDPMDLDVSSETGYQAKSYAGNPQDNALRDALDNAIATPEGQALVGDIHKSWDESSKAKLRENPAILGNLMELKQSGHYGKIVGELEYQRGIGYLTDVPFLQAFDQVGEAMKKAGVFDKQQQPSPAADPMGQLQSNTQQAVQPVATGARKATAPKNAAPNPHLSSTPPSKQTNQKTGEPDFSKMSDEDFLKMPPPE